MPGTGTNCGAADRSCGTIFVASHDNDKVMAFDRRANDADATASPTGPEPPSASLRTLAIALKDSGATKYMPIGVAVAGNTVVVAMNGAPGFLAGYPTNFTNTTSSPSWYLRGTAAAQNKLVQPLAVAVDTRQRHRLGLDLRLELATGSNWTITGYNSTTSPRTSTRANFSNDIVAPFVTITTTYQADGIAIDSATHTLYATTRAAGLHQRVLDADRRRHQSFQGDSFAAPMGVGFLPRSDGGTVYVVDNATGVISRFPGGERWPRSTPASTSRSRA